MSSTVAELRSKLHSLTRKDRSRHEAPAKEVEWAGASWRSYAADADAFSELLAAATDDHFVAHQFIVMFTDGSWIEWDQEEWADSGRWKLMELSSPMRGDQPLTAFTSPDGMDDIDEANERASEKAEATG